MEHYAAKHAGLIPRIFVPCRACGQTTYSTIARNCARVGCDLH